jgi:hypothetical protein
METQEEKWARQRADTQAYWDNQSQSASAHDDWVSDQQAIPSLIGGASPGLFGDVGAAEAQEVTDLRGYRDVLADVPRFANQAISQEAARGMAGAMGMAGSRGMLGGAGLRAQGAQAGRTRAGLFAEMLPGLALAKSEAAGREADILRDAEARREGRGATAVDDIATVRAAYTVNDRWAGASDADKSMAISQLTALGNSNPDPVARAAYQAEIDMIVAA